MARSKGKLLLSVFIFAYLICHENAAGLPMYRAVGLKYRDHILPLSHSVCLDSPSPR